MLLTCPRRSALLVPILSLFATLPAAGQTINEDAKFAPSDGAGMDALGGSVAISGTTAVVGVRADDDNGESSGSAYLFDTTTGQQLFKLVPSDNAAGDEFGCSVAISGTTAVVGAFRDDDNGPDSGSAYVFDTTTGQLIFKLLPNDGAEEDFFGESVAISGTTAVIGARLDDDVAANSGSAYVFDTTTGQQLLKLLPSDGETIDSFGVSVAISGTTAIVGAFRDDDNGPDSGSAYLFDTTTGQQLFKILPSFGGRNDEFGGSVAISGTTAVVGAKFENGSVGSLAGAAYVFDTTNGQQLFRLVPSDTAVGDRFGGSVAISGTRAVIGARLASRVGSNSGSAYLFDTVTGLQLFKLRPSDNAPGDEYGSSVSISNTTAVVGARFDDDVSFNSGSVYVFSQVAPCSVDLTGDGVVNFFDISAFLTAFATMDPVADFFADGLFNFFDISAYLKAFVAGCP